MISLGFELDNQDFDQIENVSPPFSAVILSIRSHSFLLDVNTKLAWFQKMQNNTLFSAKNSIPQAMSCAK